MKMPWTYYATWAFIWLLLGAQVFWIFFCDKIFGVTL